MPTSAVVRDQTDVFHRHHAVGLRDRDADSSEKRKVIDVVGDMTNLGHVHTELTGQFDDPCRFVLNAGKAVLDTQRFRALRNDLVAALADQTNSDAAFMRSLSPMPSCTLKRSSNCPFAS